VPDSPLEPEIVAGQNTWHESPEFQGTLDEIEAIKTEAVKRQSGTVEMSSSRFATPLWHSIEGRDEEVLRWALEVTKLRVHEGFHPRGGFVDPVPFVSTIWPEYGGPATSDVRDVSVCVGDDSALSYRYADLCSLR